MCCRIVGPAPCVTYSGTYKGLNVHVVWNGKDRETGVDNVGTVPASLATYLSLLAFKPDVVISAGTAGGFKAQVRGKGSRKLVTPALLAFGKELGLWQGCNAVRWVGGQRTYVAGLQHALMER